MSLGVPLSNSYSQTPTELHIYINILLEIIIFVCFVFSKEAIFFTYLIFASVVKRYALITTHESGGSQSVVVNVKKWSTENHKAYTFKIMIEVLIPDWCDRTVTTIL